MLAISATFTAESLAGTLGFWMRELGWKDQVRFAPYNQVFQQLLDSTSLIAGNRHGINFILVRFEDWARFGRAAQPDLAELEEHTRRLISSLESAARAFFSPIVVCICPASPAFLADPVRAQFQRRMEDLVASSLRERGTLHTILPGQIDDLYPVADPHDPLADQLGHVPYTPLYFAALGTMLARKAHALRMRPYKVIALDCDETLWKGICGEDGPEGVVIDAPRQALQDFMLRQHDAGMLLSLVSKNNLSDVLDTFRLHPGMPLRLDHFAAMKIDWGSKAASLVELALELDLGTESFIFLDDNPKEVSEVEANCPDVLALALPADAAKVPLYLRHVWAFDHAKVTDEDRQRTRLYAAERERERAERQASSLEEFIESLAIDVRIAPVQDGELRRVAQLTERTNQMNFTTVRRPESEIQALAASGRAECLTVHVADRFGDYGLTGVMIFQCQGDTLEIDTFLLSCRALGRGVEHRMLAALGRIAAERGLATVEASFVRTPRNLPALLFLEEVGLPFQHTAADGLRFRFPTASAAAIQYKPGKLPRRANSGRTAPRTPAPDGFGNIPYARIAAELCNAHAILDRVRGSSIAPARNRAAATPYAPPATELERRVAAIWSDSLGINPVGIHDDFFDLGGHSLLAVELLARIHHELGVDLSMELVYSGAFTIAEVAKAIELKEMVQAGGDRYQDLLREIESLSDEEVRQLLAEEGDPSCEFS
jgi:FkbH-like protein